MPSHKLDLSAFFKAYAKRSDDALKDPPKEDIEGIAKSFAPHFVGSSPRGVVGGANNESFARRCCRGNDRYRQMGGKAMRVTKVETLLLDDANAMAKVDWESGYVRPSDHRSGTIDFANRYLLNIAGPVPKIYAYITPDEEQAIKAHGLF
jgi:hypothetical protein